MAATTANQTLECSSTSCPFILESKLLRDLFTNYDPGARPVTDATEPIQVNIGMALVTVLKVDIVRGIARLNLWLRASWYDPRLDWKSEDYGGVWQTSANMRDMWVPDFLIYNHVDKFKTHVRHDESKLYLYSDGWGVYWSRPAVINVLVTFDVSHFPFDTQTIELETGSWSFSGLLQNLSVMSYTIANDDGSTERVTNGNLDFSVFRPSAEYSVEAMPAKRTLKYYACCPSEPWPIVTFRAVLTRNYQHYMSNSVMPVMIVTGISFTAFILPHASSERIGLGVTCILVISAIMYVTSGMIPISDTPTVLGTYYTGTFFFNVATLFLTIVGYLLYNQDKEDGDGDGIQGTYFFVDVLGVNPKTALKVSMRIDLFGSICFPLAFANFCVFTLNPALSSQRRAIMMAVISTTVFVCIFASLVALYWWRKYVLGHTADQLERFRSMVSGSIPEDSDPMRKGSFESAGSAKEDEQSISDEASKTIGMSNVGEKNSGITEVVPATVNAGDDMSSSSQYYSHRGSDDVVAAFHKAPRHYKSPRRSSQV
jgi:hypothetical protein